MWAKTQWKSYDAVIGDITLLADRMQYVDFTLPFAESGLSMIVPVKPEGSAWMFMKPFTLGMWGATGAILIYTMSVHPIQNLMAPGRTR
jgi:ionotropic glutamate receptor